MRDRCGDNGSLLRSLQQGIFQWNRTTRRTAMHSGHESTPGVQASGMGSASDTHLPGRWITAIHIIWADLIICTLVIFFTSLPIYFAQLQILCQTASCASGQLSLSAAQGLHTLGLTLKDYATLSLLLGMAWSKVISAPSGFDPNASWFPFLCPDKRSGPPGSNAGMCEESSCQV